MVTVTVLGCSRGCHCKRVCLYLPNGKNNTGGKSYSKLLTVSSAVRGRRKVSQYAIRDYRSVVMRRISQPWLNMYLPFRKCEARMAGDQSSALRWANYHLFSLRTLYIDGKENIESTGFLCAPLPRRGWMTHNVVQLVLLTWNQKLLLNLNCNF